MRRRSTKSFGPAAVGLMLACAVLFASLSAKAREPSAVRRAALALSCAKVETDAAPVLDLVYAADIATFGVPAEDLGTGASHGVRARSIDGLLASLNGAAARFPSLRTRVAEVVLRWSFCAIHYDDRAWNLSVGVPIRRILATAPKGGWKGFRAWGFERWHRDGVRAPELLVNGPLGPGQQEFFVHAVTRERCFPNPATGHTVFEDHEVDADLAAPLSDESPAGDDTQDSETDETEEDAKRCPDDVVASPRNTSPPPGAVVPTPSKPPQQTSAVATTATAPEGATAASPLPITPSRFSGNAYTGSTLAGVLVFGTRASYSPYSFLFARAGIEARRPDGEWTGSTSWGVGYDDWHPGTLFAQINDWSVDLAKPNLKGVALDAGYRLPLPERVAKYIGANVGVNVPWGLPVGLVSNVTVKPIGDLFVTAGVRTTPSDFSQWSWVYGFGLSNWRPFTVSAQYTNWGPNKAFKPNFLENGAVTASFSWAF